MIDFISVKEAAEKFGISERWVQKLCEENRIKDVIHFWKSWAIPKNAEKPTDRRRKEEADEKNISG